MDSDFMDLAKPPQQSAGRAGPVSAPRLRTRIWFWLLFTGAGVTGALLLLAGGPLVPVPKPVSAVALGVFAFAFPLALIVAPCVLQRHVLRQAKSPAAAFLALFAAVVSAVGLAIVAATGGQDAALAERGQWTRAVVTDIEDGRTDRCRLRTTDGEEIPLPLTDDCDAQGMSVGQTVHVLNDPQGAVPPQRNGATPVDPDPAGYLAPLAALAAVVIAGGTYGCVRVCRVAPTAARTR